MVVASSVEVTSRANEIPFLGPVPVRGPRRGLGFDFQPPGESHKASRIHAVLVAANGRRDTLRSPSFDRRGEARVRLMAREPEATVLTEPPGTRYRAVELWSDIPVRIRTVRWWSGR
ncbi:MAG: hypothetical protein OEV95_09735 [Gemmatimonadota bacterium]|nr:hypothetical protein [Gemmatimonadota bacterium]